LCAAIVSAAHRNNGPEIRRDYDYVYPSSSPIHRISGNNGPEIRRDYDITMPTPPIGLSAQEIMDLK